jgi:hypothetical protein
MPAAPLGATVRIYLDVPGPVLAGDAVQTPTGRTYLVIDVRRQTRGARAGRWHLVVVVVERAPEGAHVHRIRWYRRDRRPARPT